MARPFDPTHIAGQHQPGQLDDLSDGDWEQLFGWELRFSEEPGVLDAGTQILVALRRRTGPPRREEAAATLRGKYRGRGPSLDAARREARQADADDERRSRS